VRHHLEAGLLMGLLGERSITRALAALLVVWACLFLAVASLVERGEAAVLLPVLAGLVGALGLWAGIPRLGPLAGLVATILFAGLRFLAEGSSGLPASAGVALVGLVGAGLLAEALALQTARESLQARHDARLIEELTPVQSGTGLLKPQHAARELGEELSSARRYRYAVSVVLLAVDGWEPNDEQQAVEEMGRLLLEQVRSTDRVSYRGNGEFLLILTHTGLSGALAVVDKCRLKLRQDIGVDQRAGVAEFPTDGASVEDLFREAEAALEFARGSGLRVASRDLLGS
jgi:GGDEF domain-containing protein